MLKTSRVYIRQAVVVDGAPMIRIASTVVGRARRVFDGVFRRPAAPVPKPNLIVAKPPAGIVVSALNGVCRGGFVSRFVARSYTSELITAARNRYGFRLVTGSSGAGNAFKGLGHKLSAFAFVAVGVAAGVDENEMLRRTGTFDTVCSNIQAVFTSSKNEKDISFELCDNDSSVVEASNHVFSEFNLNWGEQDETSYVFVRHSSSASLDSNSSYDSDITVLSDVEPQEEQRLQEEEEEEEVMVIEEDNHMSDDFECESVIAELRLTLSVVEAQGIQLSSLRQSIVHCTEMMKELGLDDLDQSDPSDRSCDQDEEVIDNSTDDLTWVLATVVRQRRQLDALRQMVANKNERLARKAAELQGTEKNKAPSLTNREFIAGGRELSDSSVYCKRDACCGPGLVSC